MLVKPNFYDSFRCIADKCTDTCCAGWEIDVDADTADYYASLEGDDRDFVLSRLEMSGGDVLLCREGERCRFLREDGLCELIIRLGEGALCDICREHPRFYTGVGGVTEVGSGLCCEEAARMWIDTPTGFVIEDDGEECSGETAELEAQLGLIGSIGDGCLGERLYGLLGGVEDAGLYARLRGLFFTLEVMDKGFPESISEDIPRVSDISFNRLAAYFIFRYYHELGEELTLGFTAVSLIIIAAMGGDVRLASKKYSGEIEYDTDNIDLICGFIENNPGLGALCKRIFV